METEIRNIGHTEILVVKMNKGEEIFAQPGAIISSRGLIELKTEFISSSLATTISAFVGGGESIFKNRIMALDNAEVVIAGYGSGSIISLELANNKYYISDSSYLSHIGEVELKYELSGEGLGDLITKTIGTNVGLLIGTVSGKGRVFLEAIGGAIKYELQQNEILLVDNYNFLATNIDWKNKIKIVNRNVNIGSKIFSGEGWFLEIIGPGDVWVSLSHSFDLLPRPKA